jgi:tetratricopeptide (TPR) repeat protein
MNVRANILSFGYAFFFVAVLLTTSNPSHAQGNIPGYPDGVLEFDRREVALLPSYCKYTQVFRDRVPDGNNPAVIEQWYSKLGQSFHHMHHYCWGLMKTNRALFLARDQTARRFYLNDSLTEIDYVIRHVPEDFILLPEILTRKGENLILLGKGSVGILELERAIDLRPDYWIPYGHISDYYKTLGDLKTARDVLDKGLAISPDAKGLLRRVDELKSTTNKKKITP